MENIKVGSILEFIGDDMEKSVFKREVLGICGKIVFTRDLNSDGSKSPAEFYEIEDLVTMGWRIIS